MVRHGPNSTARSIRQQTASQRQRCIWGFVGEHHSTVGKGGEREMVRHGQQHSAFGQTANREPAAEVRLGFRRRASRHVLGREERGRWFATGRTAQRVRSDSNSEPAAEQRCIWGFVGEHHSTRRGGRREGDGSPRAKTAQRVRSDSRPQASGTSAAEVSSKSIVSRFAANSQPSAGSSWP